MTPTTRKDDRMSMIEKAARALTVTLRHHGVELHPEDVRGLVYDVAAAWSDPSDEVIEAGFRAREHGMTMGQSAAALWKAMLTAALNEGEGE